MSRTTWGATVGTAITLQWGVVLAISAITWLITGFVQAKSAFLGGATVALPNAVLAAWLTLRIVKAGSAGAASMMMGEILKIGLTITLLVLVVMRFRTELSWPALIVGVVGALKAQWLALWVTRQY